MHGTRWSRAGAALAALLAGVALATANATAQVPARPGASPRGPARLDTAAALGCWELRIGAWKSTGKAGGLSESLPTRIELTKTRDTSMVAGGRALLMRAAPGAKPAAQPFTFWVPVQGDSVRLEWTGGFGGIVGRAHLRRDTLRGVLSTYTDVYPQHPDIAPLVAWRVECRGGRRAPGRR